MDANWTAGATVRLCGTPDTVSAAYVPSRTCANTHRALNNQCTRAGCVLPKVGFFFSPHDRHLQQLVQRLHQSPLLEIDLPHDYLLYTARDGEASDLALLGERSKSPRGHHTLRTRTGAVTRAPCGNVVKSEEVAAYFGKVSG